jgi:hypothetical protein
MKVIFCGPPHSGKSVLVNNLLRLMPSEEVERIEANGDGEGWWTNNPNQQETDSVRHDNKTANSLHEFEVWRQRVFNAAPDIVLVNIGGRLSDDKAAIFGVCDHFVILCKNGDEELARQWMQFGQSNGCKCLAWLDSELEGEDEIFSNHDVLRARITHLERGNDRIVESPVLRALAEKIIRESFYDVPIVDFYQIGRQLGFAHTWKMGNGKAISPVFYPYKKVLELYRYLEANFQPDKRYKILGANANFVAVIAASVLGNDRLDNIAFFDKWTHQYIAPCLLEKAKEPKNDDIDIRIVETSDSVSLYFTINSIDIDNSRFRFYQLPVINEDKDLYVSGRFPNWFTVSVMLSYHNPVKYFRIPGIAEGASESYLCVDAYDKEKLGSKALR